MVKCCLIIVFNHRYDKNIPVLEKLYSSRFSNLWFLVPFYNGHKKNVIPVFESSHYFQSFFAQGFNRFYSDDATHYLFLGDDCILNPSINESNILDRTGLQAGTDFLPEIIELHKVKGTAWWHAFKGIDFFNNRKGAEIKKELPSREEAIRKFKDHGVEIQHLKSSNIFGRNRSVQHFLFRQYHWRFKWRSLVKGNKLELPYPVVGGYSDILIITKESIHQFCRYCGIMAAAGLFVEIAIPTSLLLSSQLIMTDKDLELHGKALWTTEEVSAIEIQHQLSLSSLLKSFPPGQLYSHPVKLSKWKNDL